MDGKWSPAADERVKGQKIFPRLAIGKWAKFKGIEGRKVPSKRTIPTERVKDQTLP
jgi:hypothetical protein